MMVWYETVAGWLQEKSFPSEMAYSVQFQRYNHGLGIHYCMHQHEPDVEPISSYLRYPAT